MNIPTSGDFTFDSQPGAGQADLKPGQPRLLGVDNPLVVPVGQGSIRVQITGTDVIHSWAMPSFGVKMDAVPGRINETWFKVEQPGIYYGQCSELCGVSHAFMPIEVQVVSKAEFDAWLGRGEEEVRRKAGRHAGDAQLAAARRRTEPATSRKRKERLTMSGSRRPPTARARRPSPDRLARWFVYSTNHKDIGTMYLIFAIVAGLIGGAFSVMMRARADASRAATAAFDGTPISQL